MIDRLEKLVHGKRVTLAADPGTAKLQVAVFYYWIKAVRAAKAAAIVTGAGYSVEGLLLLRGVYNLVVDCLWMCADPTVRANLFYDSTAVAFERWRSILSKSGGGELGATVKVAAEANREHYDRVADQFRNRKGKDRVEWAPGSLRDRAKQLAETDKELEGLYEVYETLYGALSDYEHSAPVLCFQFVRREGREIIAAENPVPVAHEECGRMLGVLVGALVLKTMSILGFSAADFTSVEK